MVEDLKKGLGLACDLLADTKNLNSLEIYATLHSFQIDQFIHQLFALSAPLN